MTPHFEPSSDDELPVESPALDAVIDTVRRMTPDEASVQRVVSRAAAIAAAVDATVERPKDSPRRVAIGTAWQVVGWLAAVAASSILVWQVIESRRRQPSDWHAADIVASRTGDEPVVQSSIRVQPFTAVAYFGIEQDLNDVQTRLQAISEQALLAELRREAQLLAEHYRDWREVGPNP